MSTRVSKIIRLGLLVSICTFATFALSASAHSVPPAVGMVCTTDASDIFDLEATDDYIYEPDGNSLYVWSYSPDGGAFQFPGPVLCVNEGDVVTVNLTNSLSENVSIVFPGQTGVSASPVSGLTTTGLLTLEADPGSKVSYSFIAAEPGTYLYESGTAQHKQIEMGLYGALVVYPTGVTPGSGSGTAYPGTPTFVHEYLLVLHEIDPELHMAVETGLTYDWTTRHDRYWTINGRSFPDTISDNNVSWLPNQPYGGLVWVAPGETVLIRYANAGTENHPFHPHGDHLRVIARDGRLLRGPLGEDTAFEQFTRTIGSGQTYDLLFTWENLEGWTSTGTQVPVQIPGLPNLVFKDGVTFYSGSPYLGETDDLPVGSTLLNQCGEFYYPWHSHALNEFQNFDEGFGGLATLLRVDPPGGC